MSPRPEHAIIKDEECKAQLEWKIKQWHMPKNMTSMEWKHVDAIIRNRRLQGKESRAYLSGILLHPATVEKARSRHSFESTLERIIALIISFTTDASPSPEDASLIIRTPSPSAEVRIRIQVLTLIMPELVWENHASYAESLLLSPLSGSNKSEVFEMLLLLVRLLTLHADPNAPSAEIDGRTALEGAAENGRLDVAQLLLNSGSRPTAAVAVSHQLKIKSSGILEDDAEETYIIPFHLRPSKGTLRDNEAPGLPGDAVLAEACENVSLEFL
ncbi:ankyrin repeat protein [Colletotrichum incanum]|uniref:Ankyrin repeat protein n=1 Tax=Colletotrichum incanum TaxID=1573173 RepID=A0A167DXE1_COLIC|nr:ankyrin repeat protein [Colletotrichum incanum]